MKCLPECYYIEDCSICEDLDKCSFICQECNTSACLYRLAEYEGQAVALEDITKE